MSPPPDVRRLIRETVPVAIILAFWWFLAALANSVIATGLRYAGVAMALLYVVVRGIELSRAVETEPQSADPEAVLRENLRVALPAGAWFLAASVAYLFERFWILLGAPGVVSSPAELLVSALTGAGVAVVLLYAIAVGCARVRVGRTDRHGSVPPTSGSD